MGVIYAPRGGGEDIECGTDLRILQGQQGKKRNKREGAVMNQGVIKFDWGFDSVDNIHVLCGDAAVAGSAKDGGLAASCLLWKAVRVTDVGFCAYFVCPSFSERAFFLGCKLIINPPAVF